MMMSSYRPTTGKEARRSVGACVFFTLFLSACSTSNPLTLSVSELGTATKSEIGSIGLRLSRAINVTGMGATEIVGSYTIDPDPALFTIRVPWGTTSIPDTLYPRIVPGCHSLVVEAIFEGATHEDVIAVRDNLFKLEELQLRQMTHILNKIALASVKSKLDSDIKTELRKSNDRQIVDEKALSSRIETLENQNPPAEKEPLDTLKRIQLQVEVLKVTALTKIKNIPGLKDVESIDQGSDTNTLQVSAIEEEIKGLRKALDNALQKPSIVVTNWSRADKMTAEMNAGNGGVSSGVQRAEQTSGYLVLGSPRITSLIIGNDLLDKANKQKDNADSDLSFLEDAKRLYITQYVLSAKQLAWSESRSGSFEVRAQIQIDKIIAALPEHASSLREKLDAAKIDVGFSLASTYAARSSGSISNAKTAIYLFDFLKGYPDAYVAESRRAETYRNVYASRATFADLVKGAGIPGSTSGSAQEGACNTRESKKYLAFKDFNENRLHIGMPSDTSGSPLPRHTLAPTIRIGRGE